MSRELLAVIVGLGAALLWGLAAYLATLSARQFGGMLTNFGVQIASLAVLGPVALLLLHLGGGSPRASDLGVLVLMGAVRGALNLVAYHLLTVGTVAVIFPILAGNNAVVTLLAVLLFHERLDVPHSAGVILVTVGVLAIAYAQERRSAAVTTLVPLVAEPGRSRKDLVPTQTSLSTIWLAVVVAVAFGCALFVVIHYIKLLGWYLPLAVDRSAQAVVSIGFFAAGFPPRRHLHGHASRWWVLLALAGIVDAAGLAVYGLGNQVASTAIVATTSSTFIVVPVLVGIFVIHERLRGPQLAGIVCVVIGLILLGA